MIEAAGHRIGNLAQILVAAVTGSGQHHDAPPDHIQALRQIGHHADRMGIVAVVEQHLERMLVEHVHATRRLEEGGVEGAQALADGIQLDAHGESHGGGHHGILHIVHGPALQRGRNQVRPQQRNVPALVVQGDHLAVDAGFQCAGAATGANVFAHQAVLRVHGDVADHLGIGVAGHLQYQRIIGIEHRAILGHLDDDALDLGELFEGIDAFHAQMIGLHVEHRADIHRRHAHAGAQQATARDLEYRKIDLRIGQHHARGNRSGHVAFHRALAVDVDAIGGGEAGRVAGHLGDVGEHARRGGLAVGAGNRGNRHARRRARGEQHVDHRASHIARLAFARRHVHAESGCRIALADAAADRLVALGNVGGKKIHAADIEANGADGTDRHVAIVRVDDVGHIRCRTAGGQVGGGAQVDDAVLLRHACRRHLHACHHHVGLRIEFEFGQHFFMADTAAWIGVHFIDQLRDGVHAITHHMTRRASGCCNQFTIDHQQAVVITFEEGFHDHRA